MINLDNVTIVAVNGSGENLEIAKSLKYSTRDIKFSDVLLFSSSRERYDFCKTIDIHKLDYDGYSKFILTEIGDHIETDYFLIVQDDGFVINPSRWNPDFLEYDYIGAPWPFVHVYQNSKRWPIIHSHYYNGKTYQVGNGGFSLRSKKLMDNVKKLYTVDYDGIPEDAVICIGMRNDLESMGRKFPDVFTAASFSCEARFVDVNGIIKEFSSDHSFGFHCKETHPDKVNLLTGEIL